MHTYAGFVQTFVKHVPKNAKSTLKWVWITAGNVQKLADGALKRVRRWPHRCKEDILSKKYNG
ncbi:hypothetical protein GCM10011325_35890 [Dyadobacter sediminis]|nr:hypothetical protein GCM10011325_35890 [Dyadobacter sediminis]